MAQIIMFPSGEVQTDERAPVLEPATPKPTGRSVVVAIRGRRIPRRNRDEDEQTIMFARIAASTSARAEEAGKKEWGSEAHRAFLGMSRITDKLPRNNLRILTTPDDIVEGLWRLWRRLSLLNLEWRLCEERRMDAVHDHDETLVDFVRRPGIDVATLLHDDIAMMDTLLTEPGLNEERPVSLYPPDHPRVEPARQWSPVLLPHLDFGLGHRCACLL